MTPDGRPRNVLDLLAMKREGRKIVMLTAYDALFARLLVEAGVDVLLVGDSVNQVLAGEDSTLSATLDQMIYHGRAVRKGSGGDPAVHRSAVPDLPGDDPRRPAQRRPGHAGDRRPRRQARRRPHHGAHRARAGGYRHSRHRAYRPHAAVGPRPRRVPGAGPGPRRGGSHAGRCPALEEAGACALVLELVPASVAERIRPALTIPTVGIGAGAGVRRPGPGDARHAGPQRPVHAEVPQALRRAGRHGPRRGRGNSAPRCARARIPGKEQSFE